jgi:hydrogenase maturation factor
MVLVVEKNHAEEVKNILIQAGEEVAVIGELA